MHQLMSKVEARRHKRKKASLAWLPYLFIGTLVSFVFKFVLLQAHQTACRSLNAYKTRECEMFPTRLQAAKPDIQCA